MKQAKARKLATAAIGNANRQGERAEQFLEAALTYCVFLTLHGVHRAPLMRCLSAYHNRDEEALERLPLMMAGAMYQQSRLDREQGFKEGREEGKEKGEEEGEIKGIKVTQDLFDCCEAAAGKIPGDPQKNIGTCMDDPEFAKKYGCAPKDDDPKTEERLRTAMADEAKTKRK